MKKLIELRKQKHLTQQEIADILFINRNTYQNYESGRTQPDFATLIRIATFFQVSIDYLLNHQENKQLANASDLTKIINDYVREMIEGKVIEDSPSNHQRLAFISDLIGRLDNLTIEQIKAFHHLLKEFDKK